jgi:hypothetical protein
MDESAQRRATNEDRFRAANEEIGQKAVELQIDDRVPFLCECADERCREILLLPLEKFAAVRQGEVRFVIAPGHDSGPDEVVERTDTFHVVEKTGEEAELLRRHRKADGA